MRRIGPVMRQKIGPAIQLEKWGLASALGCVEDPDGVVLPEGALEAASLSGVRIPENVWGAVLMLYQDFMEHPDIKGASGKRAVDNGLEVAVFFTIDEHQRIRAWVPTQGVTGASVEIDYTQPIMDIVSGEVIEAGVPGLPDGTHKCGSSHSHNDMRAFFSSTDDMDELPQPGYHIVVGNLKQDGSGLWGWDTAPSIVMGGRRYLRVFEDLTKGMETRGLLPEDIAEQLLLDSYDWDRGVLSLISIEIKHKGRSRLHLGKPVPWADRRLLDDRWDVGDTGYDRWRGWDVDDKDDHLGYYAQARTIHGLGGGEPSARDVMDAAERAHIWDLLGKADMPLYVKYRASELLSRMTREARDAMILAIVMMEEEEDDEDRDKKRKEDRWT